MATAAAAVAVAVVVLGTAQRMACGWYPQEANDTICLLLAYLVMIWGVFVMQAIDLPMLVVGDGDGEAA